MKTKAAVIVDEFTLENLKDHWQLYEIDYQDPLKQIEQFKPDLLFVESVWTGVNGSWRGLFSAKSRKLQAIVEFCRLRSIPTVFWNKEDPVHFDDFTERCDIAGWFDYIFTSELDCVGDYAAKYPGSRCFVLPFFYNENKYQPTLTKKNPGYFFAGTYYKKFAERNIAFDNIMAYLGKQGATVSIYDRNFGSGQKDLEFPERYKPFLKGKVDPAEMVSVYQEYQHCINLNTVQNGQTMFARRVIECLACHTSVLSNYSRALDILFQSKRRIVADNVVEYSPLDCIEIVKELSSEKALHFIESVVLEAIQPTESVIAQLNTYAGYTRTTLESVEHVIRFTEAEVNRPEVSCQLEDDTLRIQSSLPEDQHGYINFSQQFDVRQQSHVHFLFEASASAALLDVWLLNKEGELIFRNIYSRTQEISVGIPSAAVSVKVAVRVTGPHHDLTCKLALGRKIKIPTCILPLHQNYHILRGPSYELIERLNRLPVIDAEILYYTDDDFDFSYQVIQGYPVVIGGDLVKAAVDTGRLLYDKQRERMRV